MKRKAIPILALAVGGMVAGIFFWGYSRKEYASNGLSVLPGTLVFRAFCGTETMYFIFQTNFTYSLLVRMHMGTWEFDHGAWVQNEVGKMTLTSQIETNKRSHISALRYKSYVALYSPDQTFVKIRAPSVNNLKAALDMMSGDIAPRYIFAQVNAEKAVEEASSPQPFIFFPVLNMLSKLRSYSVELQEGSPLTPNKAPEDTARKLADPQR